MLHPSHYHVGFLGAPYMLNRWGWQVLVAADSRFVAASSPAELVSICRQWTTRLHKFELPTAPGLSSVLSPSLVGRAMQLLHSCMEKGSGLALQDIVQQACSSRQGEKYQS